MKDYSIDNIINLAVSGHASTGKTMLCESILFNAKKIRNMGGIDSNTTVSDYHDYEHNLIIMIMNILTSTLFPFLF